MSKTFKNATNSGTEVYVGEGINADSVQLIIRNVGSGIGKAGIYLNSSDIPALALAILEAAGYKEEQGNETTEAAHHFGMSMLHLRYGIKEQEYITAEAEAQAKLEAEALELFNASRLERGLDELDWVRVTTSERDEWLAVARRAREINKEAINGRE